MNKEKLLQEVRSYACSCDLMIGWSCSFCKKLLPELRTAMGLK